MVECQVRYIMNCLRKVIEQGQHSIDVRASVHDAFVEEVDQLHDDLVWTHKGLTNWFWNPAGRVFAVLPYRLVDYWRMTSTFDPSETNSRRSGGKFARHPSRSTRQSRRLRRGRYRLPKPAGGELQVKVAAVGIGHVDALVALGRYQVKPALPHVPGVDVARTVSAVGDGVSSWQVGDRMMAMVTRGFAEHAIAPAALTVKPVGRRFEWSDHKVTLSFAFGGTGSGKPVLSGPSTSCEEIARP